MVWFRPKGISPLFYILCKHTFSKHTNIDLFMIKKCLTKPTVTKPCANISSPRTWDHLFTPYKYLSSHLIFPYIKQMTPKRAIHILKRSLQYTTSFGAHLEYLIVLLWNELLGEPFQMLPNPAE